MILDLGRVDYETAYCAQKELVASRKCGTLGDSIILAEHDAIFTIGRSGKKGNLLVDEEALLRDGIRVLSVDRGGEITFHGPGQLVLYPIIDLRAKGLGLHGYMRLLEEAAIATLKEYSIYASRDLVRTGVWVAGDKIASIGIAASSWITYHGMSLNVNVDLHYFSMIIPCGIKGVKATSMACLLSRHIEMDNLKCTILSHLDSIFYLGYKKDARRKECAMLA